MKKVEIYRNKEVLLAVESYLYNSYPELYNTMSTMVSELEEPELLSEGVFSLSTWSGHKNYYRTDYGIKRYLGTVTVDEGEIVCLTP